MWKFCLLFSSMLYAIIRHHADKYTLMSPLFSSSISLNKTNKHYFQATKDSKETASKPGRMAF